MKLANEKGDSLNFELEFDPAKEFMLVKYVVSGNSAGVAYSSEILFAYKNIDDVWVPSMRHEVMSLRETITTDKKLTLTNIELSASPPDGFTLASLDPKDGDVLVDKIEGKVMLIENGQAVEPSSYNSNSRMRLWTRFLLGSLVIGSIAALLWYGVKKKAA